MNYHLFQKDSQSVFSKKKIKSNQNHKIGKECHEHCTTFNYIGICERHILPGTNFAFLDV